ncbi:hypothetical protein [Falsiroseomonas tokyonensis]|uniref:Uncharacterized protein n=1 Tax=Falsiroseomonas tokyonensis TaxID=430521 RepID=A0ABV7BVC8_9PROT|nr:hypothetical protein [Falsiroseomonas tokyonensis]MBU8537950.1 hypothetical protein [Falsiroseomonas tokyonensis]
MTAIPTVFGDGIIDVHVASGVVRITLGMQTAASASVKEGKPEASAMLVVPVLQLPNLARVLAEVTRQIEAKAKENLASQAGAQANQGQPAQAEPQDQVAGAFRFNG